MKSQRPTNHNSGFTLIELLVVIAIIAVLVAILMLSMASVLGMAKDVKCKSNLKAIGDCFMALAYNHEGVLPGNMTGWSAGPRAAWQMCWLGDEILRPGDNFPSWWIPGAVQPNGKGTIYEYLPTTGLTAQKYYLCPATKPGVYGSGVGSNGRFSYTSPHVFSGAFVESIPMTCDVKNGGTVVRTISTPLLVEEDHYWWSNRVHIEPGTGNADRLALNHSGRGNYYGVDGGVHSERWDFIDNRGVTVGPDCNMLWVIAPSGKLVNMNGGSYLSWQTK